MGCWLTERGGLSRALFSSSAAGSLMSGGLASSRSRSLARGAISFCALPRGGLAGQGGLMGGCFAFAGRCSLAGTLLAAAGRRFLAWSVLAIAAGSALARSIGAVRSGRCWTGGAWLRWWSSRLRCRSAAPRRFVGRFSAGRGRGRTLRCLGGGACGRTTATWRRRFFLLLLTDRCGVLCFLACCPASRGRRFRLLL